MSLKTVDDLWYSKIEDKLMKIQKYRQSRGIFIDAFISKKDYL